MTHIYPVVEVITHEVIQANIPSYKGKTTAHYWSTKKTTLARLMLGKSDRGDALTSNKRHCQAKVQALETAESESTTTSKEGEGPSTMAKTAKAEVEQIPN